MESKNNAFYNFIFFTLLYFSFQSPLDAPTNNNEIGLDEQPLSMMMMDSDGDSIDDTVDLDDDNDGILDSDECDLPTSNPPNAAGDALSWSLNGTNVFTVGNNTNGLGYQESGFELATINSNNTDVTVDGPLSTSGTTGTWDHGTLSFVQTGGTISSLQLANTTNDDFTSGANTNSTLQVNWGTFNASQNGVSYVLDVDFNANPAIYAFSFDINDSFDGAANLPFDPDEDVEIAVRVDGVLVYSITAPDEGSGGVVTGTVRDANGTVRGAITAGGSLELTIGFIASTPISNVEITYTNTTTTGEYDNVGIDNFVYATVSCPDTDGDGLTDNLDLDSDGDGCYDKIEAGVTGFTTNGLVTDSLAATTAGEVGANGLDNDIENNDTQSATTSGSYTITQTNSGTNDFQDGAVYSPDCLCTFTDTDTDGDGICDSSDIDDDNDGIRDIDEGACGNGLTSETAFPSLGYARNVTVAGIYYFNIGGQSFSTYVDANGYVQVAIDFGNGTGNLPQGSALSQSARGILTPAILATLTETETVRISHSGGQLDVTTTQSTILSRVLSNNVLHAGAPNNGSNNTWTGTNASYITTDASCNSSAGTGLHQNIIHICGNTSGMHWIPSSSLQRLNYNLGEIGNTESLNLWVRAASATCTALDTDSDGTPDYLDLDSDGDGCYDKVEAGVTGYTTSGAATDSLAATTAGEVGANGLDNDIENNDTQTATTSGSYTIIQTNSGTNDFQDVAVQAPECPCTTQDNDGDGVCDLVDLDDDNDGILDVDEYAMCSNFAFTFSTPTKLTGSGSTTSVAVGDVYLYSDGISDGSNSFDVLMEIINLNAATVSLNPNVIVADLPSNHPWVIYELSIIQSGSVSGSNPLGIPVTLTNFHIDFKDIDSNSTQDFTEVMGILNTSTATVGLGASLEQNGMTGGTPPANYTLYRVNPATSGNTSDWVDETNVLITNSDHWLGLDYPNFTKERFVAGYTGVGSGTLTRGTTFDALGTSCLSMDTDGDGIANHQDLDSDNDGIPDLVEAGGVDTNGDGVIDYPTDHPLSMVDLDGDGLADIYDATDSGGSTPGWTGGTAIANPDSDGDGIANHQDLDSDNDGIPDLVELGGVDSNGDGLVDTTTDADGDGFVDIYDPNDDGVYGIDSGESGAPLVETNGSGNALNGETGTSLDSDGDGYADHVDLDSDGDGLSDLVEVGGVDTNGDGKVDTTTDADGDGYADIYDTDDDGTAGVEDTNDALLQTGGTDTDGDGKADDTAITFVDGESRSLDSDGDGILDHLDLDSDNDGLSDLVEAGGVDTNGDGKVDTTTDADGDGYADIYDTDDDGTAGVEDANDALLQTGGTDTDGDGKADDTAITFVDGESRSLDSDGDGILDHLDLDSDNDGLSDLVEAGGVDTNGDGLVDTTTDADGDGYADIYDTDDDGTVGVEDANDALLQTGGTDTDADGKADDTAITFVDGESRSLDSDGDGILDHLDLDSDNDGLSDLVEAGGVDTNGDGLVDTTTDADGDGYADIYDTDDDGTAGVEDTNDALLQTGGIDTDGDGKADDTAITFVDGESRSLDSDSDGISDHQDLDSDNDGIPDLVEAGGIDTNGNGRVDVTTDADGDGYADIYDTDDDGTLGVEDATDALVQTGGTDTDGDGKADDTAITFIDGASNSVDSDGDGKADHLDLDSENDGIPDLIEAGGSDPDNDGRVDTATLPWDADGDGLADIYDEAASDGPLGSGTNGTALIETSADTNSDGKVNSTESMVSGGTNSIDGDGDTYPNHLDLDSDNDGITDVVENASGNTSADHSSGTLDGIVGDNASVTDANNDGWHDPSTSAATDSDSDGVPDYLDVDADNDGIPDYLEGVCSTCPTFAAPSGNDTDSDGLLDLYEGLTSANANSGTNTGVSPNEDDNDGSGPVDYLDTDSDNDGAYDWTEGFDSNGDGNAVDDIILLAAAYETNNGNPGDYPTTDTDADGVPDWLDNQVSTSGYVESTRPPFLNQSSGAWVDANNNGLADIFDTAMNGTIAPTPNVDGINDHDWRDPATTALLPVDLVSFSGEEIDCVRYVLKWDISQCRRGL